LESFGFACQNGQFIISEDFLKVQNGKASRFGS
jgi:hypothetical protein